MEYFVKTLPTYRIAFIRKVGPYGPDNYRVMERMKDWAKQKDLYGTGTIFAIPQDNPTITPPENCRFDACIVIADDVQVDPPVQLGEISGGEYLVFRVEHSVEAIQYAYPKIMRIFQENGYIKDNKPIIEKYTGDLDSDASCEICVPIIKPLS